MSLIHKQTHIRNKIHLSSYIFRRILSHLQGEVVVYAQNSNIKTIVLSVDKKFSKTMAQ
jgi:conjugal transfer/entry exclusion protein